jgi:hypothetical protein
MQHGETERRKLTTLEPLMMETLKGFWTRKMSNRLECTCVIDKHPPIPLDRKSRGVPPTLAVSLSPGSIEK